MIECLAPLTVTCEVEMMEFQQALDETLKDLGFQSLKLKQKEAVEAFVKGRDVFVALPTGYGIDSTFSVPGESVYYLWLWQVYNLCHLANFVQ